MKISLLTMQQKKVNKTIIADDETNETIKENLIYLTKVS